MTKIDILLEPTENGEVTYRAVAGDRQSVGRTAGEALDALTSLLPQREIGTLVVVQTHHADQFFTAEQRDRLSALMSRWREFRDRGDALPADERAELDALVDAELQASARRADALRTTLTS